MTKTHGAKHNIHEIKANLDVVVESICSEKTKRGLFFVLKKLLLCTLKNIKEKLSL